MRTDFPEVWDSTMLSALASCEEKFQWGYMRQIAPEGENVHLHAGACFAKGLEVRRRSFYGSGRSEADSTLDGAEALLNAWGSFDPGEGQAKSIDRVLGAYDFYSELYPLATDPLKPLLTPKGPAVEFNFVLPLPGTRHPTTGNEILYAGRFDALCTRDNSDVLFVVDEKTTSQLGPTWSNQWTLRAQFTGYIWGARSYGHPVAGAVVRGISILKTMYGNAEAIVYRQQWQVDDWLRTTRLKLERAIQAWQRGSWERNYDQSCAAYGGCPFMRLCDTPTPESFIPIYYKEHVWDPTNRPA